jgi:hypothetical protein
LAHGFDHLAGLGVASGARLGVKQITVYCDLELAAIAGDKGQLRGLELERAQQLLRQPDGSGGVMSNGAVFITDCRDYTDDTDLEFSALVGRIDGAGIMP